MGSSGSTVRTRPLCLGCFLFFIYKPRKAHLRVFLLQYSRGQWVYRLFCKDPQTKEDVACRSSAELRFVGLLPRCCPPSAWIFLPLPHFPPSHKLCILELISSRRPQPDEYGSVPPGAARWRDAENTNIEPFFSSGFKMSHISHFGVTSPSGLSASTPSADCSCTNMSPVQVSLMRWSRAGLAKHTPMQGTPRVSRRGSNKHDCL